MRFTGKERDAETGLDHFGARYLSSVQGRFVIPDAPFADQKPDDPQSWNLYGYVRNSPLRNVDSDGRQTLDANYRAMLETLKAPKVASGAIRGGLLQFLQQPIQMIIGEIFGYAPRAIRGRLSPDEYKQIQRVSAFKRGALMLGVGLRNGPGVDGVDLDNAVGISLKTSKSVNALGRNAESALTSVEGAGFFNVELYIEAMELTVSQSTGLTKLQRVLGVRITKIVIFTKDGYVVYNPTAEQEAQAKAEMEKKGE